MTPARLIATFGGCGLSPRAPGTVGSLAALLVGLPLLKRPRALLGAAITATCVGWWATTRAGDGEDHNWIVIDEVAGMWIALLACLPEQESGNMQPSGAAAYRVLWPIVAFGLFRIFDIAKPGPIGTLDKRHDALGVMGDDVLAGAASAGCVLTLRKLLAFRS
ncbi:phosphatidylglycerophosphatase A [Acetobacter syzygii]|uniref:phosphatidylglycerophosphatase A family protein n=1 Tax=Acetobacter syzygii TaxID=146476 RepID=UPI0039ECE14D